MLRPWKCFRGIKYYSKKSGLAQALEEKVRRLEQSITRPPPLSKADEDELGRVLRGVLNSKLLSKSSDTPVNTHFQGLFEGLNTLSELEKPASSLLSLSDDDRISRINGGAQFQNHLQLITAFDELYYHGELSRKVASAIINHRRLTDLNHISKLIQSGGTGLFRWSINDRLLFRLQLSNRYWSLGQREASKALIVDCFDSVWLPAIRDSAAINPLIVQNLGRALIAFNQVDLIKRIISVGEESTDVTVPFSIENVSRIYLPLWQAAVVAKQPNLARSIISSCMNKLCDDMEMQDLSNASILAVNIVDVLYSHTIDKELEKSLRLDKIVVHKRDDKTAVHLIELCAALVPKYMTVALEMLPLLEEYAKGHPHYGLFTARLGLLQLNLGAESPVALSAGFV